MSASLQQQIDTLLAQPNAALGEWLPRLLPGDAGRAEATLAGLFWAKWQRQSGLHNTFLSALEPLSRALMALPVTQWIAAHHPLWRLLELLQHSGAGYQPELGRAGEKLLGDLQLLWPLLEAGDWQGALSAVEAQWQQEQNRLQRLEQRLIDSERGQLANRRAQQQVTRVINRALAGKQLSDAMLVYMHDVWFAELQWCFLQFGEASPEWQRRVALTVRLVDSLQDPADDAQRRQQLYAQIPELAAELRTTLNAHAPDQALLDQQLALIEMHHVALLKGRPLPAQRCELIANDDPWADATTTMSRDLLQQAAALELGTWFLLRAESGDSRIKLALKLEDTAQLLFVNRVGIKALQKSFEEFAYLLAIDVVAPLPRADQARNLLRHLLMQLAQRELERRRARAEEEQRIAAEQQRLAEEEARRRAARDKAVAESQALAEAQQMAAAQAREQEQQRAREQEQLRRRAVQEEQSGDADRRARSARQDATLIAIGHWIELHDEIGGMQRLKLAVKLPSSGKLIFVDREGMRCAELDRDVFAAKLLEGSARIINSGPQFEDTLARVVGSLRRDVLKD